MPRYQYGGVTPIGGSSQVQGQAGMGVVDGRPRALGRHAYEGLAGLESLDGVSNGQAQR